MSRRILLRVARRLSSLLLVVVVAGAPAALTTCEIVCSMRDSETPARELAAAVHSCHGTQPAAGPGLDAGVQVCGHDEALPAAASQLPPLSMTALAAQPPSIGSHDGARHRAHTGISSPPDHSRPPVPLRI